MTDQTKLNEPILEDRAASPLPQGDIEPLVAECAASLANMVKEWVDRGIKFETNWHTGLQSIIEGRLSRIVSPVLCSQAERIAALTAERDEQRELKEHARRCCDAAERRADRMANDWFEFCEAMEATPDTQEAVAYAINARIHNAEYTARELLAALESLLAAGIINPTGSPKLESAKEAAKALLAAVAAERERCAQIAENNNSWPQEGAEIADEIRATVQP